MWDRMHASFGQLLTEGYDGKRFPVVIGAVGSRFETPEDRRFIADVGAWLRADKGTGAPHVPVQVRHAGS